MTTISVGKIFDKTRATSKAHFSTAWKAIAIEYGITLLGSLIAVILVSRAFNHSISSSGNGFQSHEVKETNYGLLAAALFVYSLLAFLSFFLHFGRIRLSVKLSQGQDVRWTSVFRYFKKPGRFLYYYFCSLAVGFVTLVGYFLLIIPGIYLAVGYSTFLQILIAAEEEEEKPSLGQAMEASRKAIHPVWFKFFGWSWVKFGLQLSTIFLIPIYWVAPMLLVAPGVEWATLFSEQQGIDTVPDLEKAQDPQ